MNHAKAAGSSSGTGMYFNEKMIYCERHGFDDKELQDKLHEIGFWRKVDGFQRSDFNRKLCLVIQEEYIRNHLVENGVNLDNQHVKFYFHKPGNTNVHVLVSQLPIGLDGTEIKMQFKHYGNIERIREVTRTYKKNTYDTGDRVLIFKKLFCHIRSYLKIRGYWAYVKYPGQPATCRLCSETGHFVPGIQEEKGKPKTT